MEGAVFGRLFLQNDPKSFVADRAGTTATGQSRLQSLAWMTLWSTQFEVGPLSETTIGNQGGYYYSIGCGTNKACLTTPPYSAGANKYTGIGGDHQQYRLDRFHHHARSRLGLGGGGRYHRPLYRDAQLRASIAYWAVACFAARWSQPARWRALFAGKFPWMLPAPENNFVYHAKVKPPKPPRDAGSTLGIRNAIHLRQPAGAYQDCPTTCREGFSGMGTTFVYNFTRGFAFDSSMNFLPGQNGSQGMMQGLFGVRLGQQFQSRRRLRQGASRIHLLQECTSRRRR